MGEEEEDYMGDLSQFILPDPESKSSHSHLPRKSSSQTTVCSSRSVFSSSSNKKAKTLNWQEQRKVKREQKQIEEDQQTIENVEKAIPQSNIGFKMLKQMGYTPGSALGKEGSGLAEPVRLEIRRSRAGIGKEDPRMEKVRRDREKVEREREKVEREKINQEELMVDFGYRQKEKWRGRRIVVNFRKAEAALAQLENREIEKEEDKDEEKEEEEEEEEITEEDLHVILMKLRDEHHYCLFCGCKYESEDTLLSGCPGIDEDDH